MKHQIKTEIEINASAATVWEVLTNTKEFPNWNPFIKSLKGNLEKGSKLEADIDGMIFKPVILELVKEQKLVWLGKLLVKGLFDGEHSFEIRTIGDQKSIFIHSEKFSGLLVGLFKKKLDSETVNGFKAMNQALKEQSELIELRHRVVS